MATFEFVTVDVFTDRRFGGNPLAVFPNATGMADADMQALATEFNLSETTFVLSAQDARNTARVRIFNTQGELAFAGHPNVGTAFVLALRQPHGPKILTFEELAGLITIELDRNQDGGVLGATVTAPERLTIGRTFPAHSVAECVGLDQRDILISSHDPILASAGRAFVLVQVTDEGLTRSSPDSRAFRHALDQYPTPDNRFALLLYAKGERSVRSRMFSPLGAVREDAATGAANAALAAFLLSQSGEDTLEIKATQGVEMGRPSTLHLKAYRDQHGIMAQVGGPCVPVLRGEVTL